MKMLMKIISISLAIWVFITSVFLVVSGLGVSSGIGMMVFSIYVGNYALRNSGTLRKRKGG